MIEFCGDQLTVIVFLPYTVGKYIDYFIYTLWLAIVFSNANNINKSTIPIAHFF